MKTKWVALLLAAALGVFIAAFIWATLRPNVPAVAATTGGSLTAAVSEKLPDGKIEAQIFAFGRRDIRLEIQFKPDADASEKIGMRPLVNFAMVDMQMDGFEPPLELVEAGVWSTRLRLPMAGRWIVSVGFGEDIAKVEFDAQ